MKLRNKKTGEIGEVGYLATSDGKIIVNNINDQDEWYEYNSLAELNAEWEDAPEEVKEYWWISPVDTDVEHCVEDVKDEMDNYNKEIGNYFKTKEEAEKAVEKFKAWKRLKGGGFEFMSCSYGHDKTTDDTGGWIRFRVNHLYDERHGCEVEKDLDLLFGGKE